MTPAAELVTYAARLVRMVRRVEAPESPVALRLLSQLDELGPVTVTDLARADLTSQPTTSAAVHALEERGLVARSGKPGDARSTLLHLTDAGYAELRAVRSRHAAVVEALAVRHGVAAEDLRTTLRVLRTLTADDPPR